MRKWIGVICVSLGMISILSAIGFVVYNRWEDENAEEISHVLLEDVQRIIPEHRPEFAPPGETVCLTDDMANLPDGIETKPAEMATIEVNGYDCIGILSVPVLRLELPILTDWSYTKLKTAPCHYYGTYYEKNFVIAGHNYDSHFGKLSLLQEGDIIIFTDVNGSDHCYEVVLSETLPKEATMEMITSGFDLSLYTCTSGGAGRVTVRCHLISPLSEGLSAIS